jgi:hypothetical protein
MNYQNDISDTDMFIRTAKGTTWRDWRRVLHSGNYTLYVYSKTQADGRYVTALGTNGDYVTWTKNGSANNLTVPYAT